MPRDSWSKGLNYILIVKHRNTTVRHIYSSIIAIKGHYLKSDSKY